MERCPACGRPMRTYSAGNAMRQHRLSQQKTLDDVHAATGLTKSMLSRIETKPTNPSITTVRTLADYYGVGLADIEAWIKPDGNPQG